MLVVAGLGGVQSSGRHSQPDCAGEEGTTAFTYGQLLAEVRLGSVQVQQLHVSRVRLASSVSSVS